MVITEIPINSRIVFSTDEKHQAARQALLLKTSMRSGSFPKFFVLKAVYPDFFVLEYENAGKYKKFQLHCSLITHCVGWEIYNPSFDEMSVKELAIEYSKDIGLEEYEVCKRIYDTIKLNHADFLKEAKGNIDEWLSILAKT